MKLTTNQIWTIIVIVGIWAFGETAVAFKRAGITAQSLDLFFTDLTQGELFAAIGASLTGGAGFFVGGRYQKAKLVEGTK
jgi:hypothetical protein